MDIKEAVIILESHNIWRRGAETEPTKPKQLGIAIDTIVNNLKSKNMEFSEIMQDTTRFLVLDWARKKGIAELPNIHKQTLKLSAEVGEFSEEILQGEKEKAKMELGDIMVVLTILADMLETNTDDCMLLAYDKIQGRTGRTVDGVFIKD